MDAKVVVMPQIENKGEKMDLKKYVKKGKKRPSRKA